ncbi:MAG: DNA gyrase subunit A, partial [Mycoplasmataceae bacterium]|nr:DNA gyrase subunit A [Mycoplasmataceae bacterium]
TKLGIIRRTPISQYQRINVNGKIALSMRENDELVKVMKVKENDEIIIGASNGKVVRFSLNQVRPMSRTATGVTGMRFDPNENATIIGASNTSEGNMVLSIGSNGFGKKTPLDEYRITKRGAKGVKTINTNKSGELVYVGLVNSNEDIMVVTNKGIAIRTSLKTISDSSRSTKGVKVIQIKDNSKIQSVAILDVDQIEKEFEEEYSKTQELILQNNQDNIEIDSSEDERD